MAKRKLTSKQLKCIDLLVKKDLTRGKKRQTNEDIANIIGVNASTIYEWKKIPEFNEELNKQGREYNSTMVIDAFQHLRAILNNPGTSDTSKLKAIELIMKSSGDFRETRDINISSDESNWDERKKKMQDRLKNRPNSD